MSRKSRQVFQKKIEGWHPQLPPRVSPILVTPLPSWAMSSLRQPFVSGVVDSCRSMMSVLYTFYCNISHMLLSVGFKSVEFGSHSSSGINYGVSFCNNSTKARAQWAFQVSQGSVETVFRWGGKRLHHFAANLFKKRCIKFHNSRLSCVGDITKKTFWSLFFFWIQCIDKDTAV